MVIGRVHCRRLRDVWRSAGWPWRDAVEIDLLAAGLLERVGGEREVVRVTDAGIALLGETIRRNRAARDAHEALVARVATEMQRAGRIVWRGIGLRAKVDDAWSVAMPDVFSIRHTTREDAVEPVVHEIKVRRADLLADQRRAAKGAAYCELSSECWYVIRAGIAEPDEIAPPYGVMVAHEQGFEVARAAPKRALKLPFHVWIALARAVPESVAEQPQGLLGGPAGAQSVELPRKA